MKINRRDFLKWAVAASVALNLDLDMDKLNIVLAADTDPPVIWLEGSTCAGCTISFLNVTKPTTVDNVLTTKISLKYNAAVSAKSGESAMQAIDKAASTYKGQFILVVEGAIPTAANGEYCILGEVNNDPLTMKEAVLKYGPMAKYVVAAGTCASFGGISATAPNTPQCSSAESVLKGTSVPIVNLPSCPVNPTILVQTLLDLILTGVPSLTTNKTPTKYYEATIHSTCPRKGTTEGKIGETGCLGGVGCNGPKTSAYCVSSKWNNGINWCIGTNSPCIGCANPTFPTNPLLSSGASPTASPTSTNSSNTPTATPTKTATPTSTKTGAPTSTKTASPTKTPAPTVTTKPSAT